MSNYELNVISNHKDFDGKTLKKYCVDGIDTIGAYGSEPFTIQFKNNTWQKVQVKLSVDGTDILTGKPATTDVDHNMWVVNAYGTLSLKAWPENNQGGAAFVFTSANNSVAIHTHGDLSARGIIAAAVFVEGHVEPTPIYINPWPWRTEEHHHHHHHYDYNRGRDYFYGPIWINAQTNALGANTLGGVIYNNSVTTKGSSNAIYSSSNISYAQCNTNNSATYDSCEVGESLGLDSLVAVGAGQYVNQNITHVAGLIKPTLSETVRVRYLWWDELQTKLREHNVPAPHASGFPGDKGKKNIDLKNTPRMGGGSHRVNASSAPVYSRI